MSLKTHFYALSAAIFAMKCTGYFLDQWQDVDNLWEDENKKMDPFYSFDHTGTIIAWDYNYDGVEKELTFGIGINDPFDRCLYGIA